MAEESGKRRRGRKRQRGEARRPIRPEGESAAEGGELEITAESDIPGVTGSRFRLWRRGREPEGAGKGGERRRTERAAAEGAAPGVKPMDFWRSSRVRSYREAPVSREGGGGLLKRFSGMYLPPWVPVVGIIVIVFGILGFLFFTRTAVGAPRIGRDHWHATYQYWVCGERQPNAPAWEAGVHTHADGVIHIHPFTPAEEGAGARLVKWFEYGGGKLTKDEVRAPGSRDTYKNGDTCPDGRPGEVQVFVNGQKLDDFSRYIPKDGDRVRIVFGPPEEVVTQNDRTIIPEGQASRTVEITVTDDGSESSTKFEPASIEVNTSETVKIIIKNAGKISHGFRAQGDDGQYDTSDDYVSNPDVIKPGEQGVAVVRFDTGGATVEFRDETLNQITGSITVKEGPAPTVTPSPTPSEAVDTELDLTVADNSFNPAHLEVGVGQKFRIRIQNAGSFAHSLRVAGPDNQFETDDDLVAVPDTINPGKTAEIIGQFDKPGTYQFRDDFWPTLMTGTITVK